MEHYAGAEEEADLWSYPVVVCLVCATPILKSEQLDDDDNNFLGEGDDEESSQSSQQKEGDEQVTSSISILHHFFKTFHVRRGPKKEWQLESEKLPFCQGCKAQLKLIFEVQQKVEELQTVIRNEVRDVREKIGGFESEFQSQGVYKRDRRYFHVRREILGDSCLDPDEELKKKLNLQLKQEESSRDPTKRRVGRPTNKERAERGDDTKKQLGPRRKSTRRVERPSMTWDEAGPSCSTSSKKPVVLITATDMAVAQEFLPYPPSPDAGFGVDSQEWDDPPPYQSSQDKHETQQRAEVKKLTKYPKGKGRPSTTKGAKYTFISDDEMDWEEDDPPTPPKKRPSKRDADDDFIPEADAEELAADEEDEEKLEYDEDKKRGVMRIDEKTGLCSYRDVTLEKLVDSEQYRCQSCSELVPNTEKDLKVHVIRVHTRLTECRTCGRRFNSVAQLRHHVRHTHQGVARPKFESDCPICGRPRMRVTLMRRHMWTHYSEQDKADAIASGIAPPKPRSKQFMCDVCGHQTKSSEAMDSHKKSHQSEQDSSGGGGCDETPPPKPDQEELHLCPQCGRRVKYLRQHLRTRHPPESLLMFPCTTCNKRFASAAILAQHQKHHKLELKCHLCPRGFALQKQLQRHINLHLNIRPFQCQHCPGIGFIQKHHLDRHIKIYHEVGSKPGRTSYVTKGPRQQKLEQKGKSKKNLDSSKKLDLHTASSYEGAHAFEMNFYENSESG